MPDATLRGEEARNRRLRRADWRFLLPTPRPARSVCYADGPLAQAVADISVAVIRPQPGLNAVCDLAVAVNPSGATLRAALAALQPGGACYTEWYTPLSGGWRGVRRRLVAAGFEEVRLYWAWPLPSRAPALFWLPLDAPHVLRYFLSSRPHPGGMVHGLAGRLQRLTWRASRQAGLLWPVYAVARKPGLGDGQTAPHHSRAAVPLDHVLRAGWEAWGLGPRPERLARLLLTGGHRSINKAVALVFRGQERSPRVAVKMTRVPESGPALAHEAATLRALQASGGAGLPGAPRVLFETQQGDTVIVGETALSGVPLWTKLSRSTYRPFALQATDWLTRLAHRSLAQPPADWRERLIHPIVDTFAAQFGGVVGPQDLDETRRSLATLDPLPLACEQRDFSPWNALVGPDGGLVVLDWESAALEGLPALDLLYLLTYLAFYLEGAMASGQFDAAYQASLDPTTFTGAVRAECLTRYCHALGLDASVLGPLRLLVWLLHARSEYQRLVADAGGPPGPEALRRSLFVRLWQAELRAVRAGNQ